MKNFNLRSIGLATALGLGSIALIGCTTATRDSQDTPAISRASMETSVDETLSRLFGACQYAWNWYVRQRLADWNFNRSRSSYAELSAKFKEDDGQLPRRQASRLGRRRGSRDSPIREAIAGAPSIMGG